MQVSWSRITTLNDCGLRFRLKYLDRVPTEDSGPLIGGAVIHQVIGATEEKVMEGETSFDCPELSEAVGRTFQELFSERVAEAGEIRWGGRATRESPAGEDFAWWMKMGPVMLRRYLGVRVTDFKEGTALFDKAIERGISVLLDDGSFLTGILDAMLLIDNDGTLKLRDWKSGQVSRASSLQLAMYSWLVERALGVHAELGEFCYLRTGGNKMIQQHKLDPLLPVVPLLLEGYAQTTAAGIFTLKPGPMCKTCEVRSACPFGQTL